MKVIDLLNKIANGEELPKKFIYIDKENVKYIFDIEVDDDYWCEELGDWFFSNFSIQTILNDEIELIEEDKEIEELDFYKITDETISGLRKSINILNNEYVDKINELIKAANELKKGK